MDSWQERWERSPLKVERDRRQKEGPKALKAEDRGRGGQARKEREVQCGLRGRKGAKDDQM